ncbi:MAG: hypothetical protein ACTHJ3_19760 [Pararhizobium sp.]
MYERDLQEAARRLVSDEVHLCVSSLVRALSSATALPLNGRPDLADLTEQAFELSCPVLDYEEAARQAGWRKIAEDAGSEAWQLGEGEDADYAAGAEDACIGSGIDPYEWEVFEHWAVSDWLADELLKRGGKVDKDFAGLIVWARTTTGQAIAMDGAIRDIVRALHA